MRDQSRRGEPYRSARFVAFTPTGRYPDAEVIGAAGRSAAHRLRGPLRHLFGRHVLHVRCDVPAVTEGILELTGAIAVELILNGGDLLGTGFDGAGEHVV